MKNFKTGPLGFWQTDHTTDKFYNLCLFKAIVEDNRKQSFEDDILRLSLGILDPSDRQKVIQVDCFGIIHKAIKLREGDKRVLEIVKGIYQFFTNLNKKVHFMILFKDCAKDLVKKQNHQSYSNSSPSKSEENNYKNINIYELSIYIKSRRYINKPYLTIDYEVIKA